MPLSHSTLTTVTQFCLPCRRRSWTRCSIFKMLQQHIWSQQPANMSAVCLGWVTMTYSGWLFLLLLRNRSTDVKLDNCCVRTACTIRSSRRWCMLPMLVIVLQFKRDMMNFKRWRVGKKIAHQRVMSSNCFIVVIVTVVYSLVELWRNSTNSLCLTGARLTGLSNSLA